MSTNSFKDEPSITGTTIKKENLAAISLSIPRKIDVPIVDPLLDIPGRIAKACDIPIITELIKLIFFFLSLTLSEKNNIIAVIISMNPTSVKLPSKSELI